MLYFFGVIAFCRKREPPLTETQYVLYRTCDHVQCLHVKHLVVLPLIVVALFIRLMEVKTLETLVRLLQGDEDADELPEQVSIEPKQDIRIQKYHIQISYSIFLLLAEIFSFVRCVQLAVVSNIEQGLLLFQMLLTRRLDLKR